MAPGITKGYHVFISKLCKILPRLLNIIVTYNQGLKPDSNKTTFSMAGPARTRSNSVSFYGFSFIYIIILSYKINVLIFVVTNTLELVVGYRVFFTVLV